MKVGEIWVEKEVKGQDEDEEAEAIRLLHYSGKDKWLILYGCIEDGLFIEEEEEAILSGKIIYTKFFKYGEA